jgi:UDP-3-O-[3-hydroxymyristoyl] glucosamine N-acyltransferase
MGIVLLRRRAGYRPCDAGGVEIGLEVLLASRVVVRHHEQMTDRMTVSGWLAGYEAACTSAAGSGRGPAWAM